MHPLAERIAARRHAGAFGLAFPKVRKRVPWDSSSKPEVEYVFDPRLGTFPTAIAAMRSYILAMEPNMDKDVSDEHIRRHWQSHSRNLKLVQVVRLR